MFLPFPPIIILFLFFNVFSLSQLITGKIWSNITEKNLSIWYWSIRSILRSCRGRKKKRVYGLWSEAKTYYGKNLCASSSEALSVSQPTSTRNMDVFVKELIPALTNHFLPVIMERVQQVVTSVDNPSLVIPMVSSTTTNEDMVDPVV